MHLKTQAFHAWAHQTNKVIENQHWSSSSKAPEGRVLSFPLHSKQVRDKQDSPHSNSNKRESHHPGKCFLSSTACGQTRKETQLVGAPEQHTELSCNNKSNCLFSPCRAKRRWLYLLNTVQTVLASCLIISVYF